MLTRTCARPACSAPAAATLAFFYGAREVCLEKLELDEIPSTYDLCVTHADRMRPPYGWVLNDRRAVARPTATVPASSENRDASRSMGGASQSAPDASRPFSWLGVAVETTVAFYPADSELFEDLSTIESTEGARLVHAVRRQDRFVDPVSCEDRPVDVASCEDRPVDVASREDRPVDVAWREDRPFDVASREDLPDEDFVPVRAQTW